MGWSYIFQSHKFKGSQLPSYCALFMNQTNSSIPPTIGVVLVVYNDNWSLQQLLPQLTSSFSEIVVVDNQNQATCQAICQQHAVSYLSLEAPVPRGQCWNIGAAQIQAEAILFLPVDTKIPPQSIERLKQIWQAGNVDYSCFKIRFDKEAFRYRGLEQFSNFRSRYLRFVYGDQGLCVKKSVFQAIRGFPEVYFLEDLKINRKLKGYRFYWIEEPLRPSVRKFEKEGFGNYIGLCIQILFLNFIGIDNYTLYQKYYPPKPSVTSSSR